MSMIVPSPFNFNPMIIQSGIQVSKESYLNQKVVTYPENVSTATYGIDLFLENFDLYAPATTKLGKVVNYVFGLSLNDEGKPNPSIFGRIFNLFKNTTKKKEIIKKEEDETPFVPNGKVTDYTIGDTSTIGKFDINYLQEGCPAPSYIAGNWIMQDGVDFSSSMAVYDEYHIDKQLNVCLINSMLEDFFSSVAEFCNNSTVCGCPDDIKLYSLIYENNETFLRVFNSDTIVTRVVLDNDEVPYPNFDLVNQCYTTSYTDFYEELYKQNIAMFLIITIPLITAFVGITTFCSCITFFTRSKKKEEMDTIELEELNQDSDTEVDKVLV